MLQHIKTLLVKKPFLSYFIILSSAILLLMPSSDTTEQIPTLPFLDKVIHIIIFGSCAFALHFDFLTKKRKKKLLLPILLFTYALLFFGGIVEVLQELFLNRTGSTSDFIADWVGVIIGFGLSLLFSEKIFRWASQ